MAKRSDTPDLIEEVEGAADRMAEWIATNVTLVVGVLVLVLASALAWGGYGSYAKGREADASNALEKTRFAYFEALGASPGAIERAGARESQGCTGHSLGVPRGVPERCGRARRHRRRHARALRSDATAREARQGQRERGVLGARAGILLRQRCAGRAAAPASRRRVRAGRGLGRSGRRPRGGRPAHWVMRCATGPWRTRPAAPLTAGRCRRGHSRCTSGSIARHRSSRCHGAPARISSRSCARRPQLAS